MYCGKTFFVFRFSSITKTEMTWPHMVKLGLRSVSILRLNPRTTALPLINPGLIHMPKAEAEGHELTWFENMLRFHWNHFRIPFFSQNNHNNQST